jgi:hypothetical protein
MVALKRFNITCTSTVCIVVISIPSVHKLLTISDRDATYRASIKVNVKVTI